MRNWADLLYIFADCRDITWTRAPPIHKEDEAGVGEGEMGGIAATGPLFEQLHIYYASRNGIIN